MLSVNTSTPPVMCFVYTSHVTCLQGTGGSNCYTRVTSVSQFYSCEKIQALINVSINIGTILVKKVLTPLLAVVIMGIEITVIWV